MLNSKRINCASNGQREKDQMPIIYHVSIVKLILPVILIEKTTAAYKETEITTVPVNSQTHSVIQQNLEKNVRNMIL